ncbi:MAG: polyphosphate polymerase domain-containing protein [Deltaproteobacteria bacterium]|nr:polyphosphate polymerase domain-containing protein [Deltaproteobacteria bacterium]MCB9788201.1 polyphosphate polymerase domain-containing protein [Deltaproteobacteria bacterium]
MATPSPLRIERREFKYLIDEDTARRVRDAVAPFCRLDTHALASPTASYRIHSLYFDTPGMDLFLANEREQLSRFKLRVRTYPDAAPTPGRTGSAPPVFFEVKRRYHDVIVKDRALAPADWARLLDTPGARLPADTPPRQAAALDAFVVRTLTHHARPVVLVGYEREPWVSTIDDYARVTFDRRISSQPRERLTLDVDPRAWRGVDHPVAHLGQRSPVVLELKFTTAVPSWLVTIVRRYDLWRRAFSKYGSAVRASVEPTSWRVPGFGGGRT